MADALGLGSQCCDEECGRAKSDKKKESASKKDLDKLKMYMPTMFWLACVSLTSFEYLVEVRTIGWIVAPIGAFLFEVGVPLSLLMFFYVSNSKPGCVPPRLQKQAMEELEEAFAAGTHQKAPNLCAATWVIKPRRSKYCQFTNQVVLEFDHFCGWLNCAIGRDNHRSFVVLTAIEWVTQISYVYTAFWVALEFVPYNNSVLRWFFSSFAHPLLMLCLMLHMVTAFYVAGLLKYQLSMIALSYTTNEHLNAERYGYATVSGSLKGSLFCKGGTRENCLDFWWYRNRGDYAPGRK